VTTVGQRLADLIGRATFAKTAPVGVKNAERNLPYIEKSVADIAAPLGSGRASESALVISAGPSLHHRRSVATVRESGYKGTCIAVDGSLGHCLRNGVVPDYVITLDPHAERILRWFGNPHLATRVEDDYFRRQDLDPAFHHREHELNLELIELVNRHGPDLKLVVATCVDPAVAERCLDAGMELYWWNPIYDDYDDPQSITRQVFDLTGVPCMVTGGNCGTAAWVFAHAILGKRHVGLAGMDLGYRPGTPLLNTQYFYELREILGDKVSDAYIPVHNPYVDEEWFTDPTYYWYRSCFLSLVRDAPCTTYNCTEGGTVFGEGVHVRPLSDFLAEFAH
jgi:hypothetical protein